MQRPASPLFWSDLETDPLVSAERFGYALTTLLALYSGYCTARLGYPYPLPLIGACFCFLATLWRPSLFCGPTKAWTHLLYHTGRLVLVLYWLLYILPMGLLMQAQGKDPLRRRFNPSSVTYWQAPQTSADMRKEG